MSLRGKAEVISKDETPHYARNDRRGYFKVKVKILISEMPDEGLNLKLDETLETDVVRLIAPVKGNLSIRKVGPEVIIRGDIAVSSNLECSRCLNDYTTEIYVPIDVMYHPVKELKAEGKHEIKEDELDMGFYAGDEFNLLDLLKEQIILNTPMKPLCSETCKGICSKCGVDLNTQSCSCSEKDIDPRLEVLRKIIDK